MAMNGQKIQPFKFAVTAVFTALVCIVTVIFSIYIPATEGFFNIGESMIFLAALLFGPFVSAFSGGVGAMLADLLLNYPHYAPATLFIKACEGAIVGMLKKKNPKFRSNFQWKFFTMIIGVVTGVLLGWIGSTYYSGEIQLTLGWNTYAFYLPMEFWLILGAMVTISISALGFLANPEFGWMVFSVIAGGFVMVSGYFLYQMFLIYPLFKIEVVAIAEVPINIGQMIIGAIVALPVAKVLWCIFPYLKEK